MLYSLPNGKSWLRTGLFPPVGVLGCIPRSMCWIHLPGFSMAVAWRGNSDAESELPLLFREMVRSNLKVLTSASLVPSPIHGSRRVEGAANPPLHAFP